ncbi:MAG: type II toxin-antitoxin system prevent-host-death family antitoxin [Candidatus Methylomirabilis sp.]|nr:type II toxin-antitoxin system prevent-host-death family antitoxin [Deltaproteobacteria bacterium]
MKKTVGAFEAKTHFSKLLDEVEKGEEIVITRRGKEVARLTPMEPAEARVGVKEAIARIRELRKGVTLGGISIRALIEEGRRY